MTVQIERKRNQEIAFVSCRLVVYGGPGGGFVTFYFC
ncbi:hypothetical protein M948_17630 [Virgibacillus sp. CM-4]|nr:hypothetical protein M948_17630 [Virgibacillus sp. CM-4]